MSVSGKDAENFLQGLISNDVRKASENKAVYALMLTPQGKFLYEFFISRMDEAFIVDCSLDQLPAIIKKLSMYKLRSDVVINDISEKYEVAALIGDRVLESIDENETGRKFCKGIAYIDPRSPDIGARSVIERENNYQSFKAYEFSEGSFSDYETTRIEAGVPSGDSDLQPEKSFPHEFGMDDLNAIDYKKGCYVGQEVTARVHHKGTLRKKIYKVMAKDAPALPAYDTEISCDGAKAGFMLSSVGNKGLAQLQIDAVEKGGEFLAGGVGLEVIG